jgi:hypothetical protein
VEIQGDDLKMIDRLSDRLDSPSRLDLSSSATIMRQCHSESKNERESYSKIPVHRISGRFENTSKHAV